MQAEDAIRVSARAGVRARAASVCVAVLLLGPQGYSVAVLLLGL